MPRNTLIDFRRDVAANWISVNPILASGEPGYETDTGKLKIGDGATTWNLLAYIGVVTAIDGGSASAENVDIEFRRDTAANWTSNNPTLHAGEVGYETDTKKLKIGDGATAWTGLSYFGGARTGSGARKTAGLNLLSQTAPMNSPAWGTNGMGGAGAGAPLIYVQLLETELFNAGDVVTGLAWARDGGSASGSPPTNMQFAVGTMVPGVAGADIITFKAVTADITAAVGSEGGGIRKHDFLAPYTVPADGTALYGVVSMYGDWGGTLPQAMSQSNTGVHTLAVSGQLRPRYWSLSAGAPHSIAAGGTYATWQSSAPNLWWLAAY